MPGRSTRSLEVMFQVSFAALVIVYLGFVAVSAVFLAAVKREAPQLFESWGKPSVGAYIWNKKWLMPFSGMLLSGNYREVLATCPKSRAWASWLSLVQWIQLILFVVVVVETVAPWAAHDF